MAPTSWSGNPGARARSPDAPPRTRTDTLPGSGAGRPEGVLSPPVLSWSSLEAEHGSPVSRAERKVLQPSTVEPDLGHASAGRPLIRPRVLGSREAHHATPDLHPARLLHAAAVRGAAPLAGRGHRRRQRGRRRLGRRLLRLGLRVLRP